MQEQESRVVMWGGERFRLERLGDPAAAEGPAVWAVWAVWRRGEFIGTMPYLADEPLTSFHERCVASLAHLVG
jgi:hypothetical protein